MVRVIGTRGKIVHVEFRGIGETILKLQVAGIRIKDGADLGVVKAASFIQEEVKESIIGNRAEAKNVDTGLLVNSIEVIKPEEGVAVVLPKKKNYPNSDANTQEVATILEFGSESRLPQPHFRNTEKRKKGDIKGIIDRAIKISLL